MGKIIDFNNYKNNFFIPIVPLEYVIQNNGSYIANNYMTDNYVYYWIGNFKTGRQVKVKSLEIARYNCNLLKTKSLAKETN